MKLFGHSPHQILIVFPAGLLLTAVVFDLIGLAGWENFFQLAYWLIVAGLIGGGVAAVFGLIDWVNIPSGTRAKRVGHYHAVGNVIVLALFLASWWLRNPAVAPSATALALGFAGGGLLFLTGWLGGELVSRLSVGVDQDAFIDASSSISRHGAVEGGTSMKLRP
jgi:uncharacterized membrane protein